MALVKQKFREIILQVLYSNNYVVFNNNDLTNFMMDQIKTTKKNISSALDYVKNIISHLDELDKQIKEASTSYDFDRISKVELSILRLALFEVQYDNLPVQIAIAEAIRLTKKFSSQHSSGFINAIIDNVCHKKNANFTK